MLRARAEDVGVDVGVELSVQVLEFSLQTLVVLTCLLMSLPNQRCQFS